MGLSRALSLRRWPLEPRLLPPVVPLPATSGVATLLACGGGSGCWAAAAVPVAAVALALLGSTPPPFNSPGFTISCLASDVLVPGLVRFIFILRPLSTVAECSTANLAAAAAAPLPPPAAAAAATPGVLASPAVVEAIAALPPPPPPACCCWVGVVLLLLLLLLLMLLLLVEVRSLVFSMSASRSMMRSPMPMSHSLSSYSKLAESGLTWAVAAAAALAGCGSAAATATLVRWPVSSGSLIGPAIPRECGSTHHRTLLRGAPARTPHQQTPSYSTNYPKLL